MESIVVEVYLPASRATFDIRIPLWMRIYDILDLIGPMLADLSNGLFQSSDDNLLCERSTGDIFNINMSPTEIGLHNGSKLMLI